MHQVVNCVQMKQLEQFTIQEMGIPSLVLMERAALAVTAELEKDYYSLERTLIVCGTGNNGADGLAVARMLCQKRHKAEVYLAGDKAHWTEELKIQKKIAENFGVKFVQDISWSEYTTIVDAIFGIGLNRNITGVYEDIIRQMNHAKARILAIDIPSGISCDDGTVLGIAVHADATVTFGYRKTGLILYPGTKHAGKVTVTDIGLAECALPDTRLTYEMERMDLELLPLRISYSNKGTYGKVLLIAGSKEMAGAAYLSALAAFRMGVGMVRILTSVQNRELLQTQLPEAIISVYEDDFDKDLLQDCIDWSTIIGIGPGMGTSDTAQNILSYVLKHNHKPLVIDADGLNILSLHPEWLKEYPYPCTITPHLGEMSRLLGQPIKSFSDALIATADAFAKENQVTVVLKDARTIIAMEGDVVFINTSGNNGMATAGSGDVLTGMILGVMARKTPRKAAAALGVYIHGLAGDIACQEKGASYMMASDMIESIRRVVE